jgi:hippurate hydrolase
MADLVHRVASGVAAAHGAIIDCEIVPGYPVTMCDPAVTARIRALAVDLVGEDRVEDLAHPIMGAEDFSYVIDGCPG